MLLLQQLALTASVGKGGRDSELDGVTTRHLIATRFVILLIAVTLREWAADRHLLLVVVVAWNVPMVVSKEYRYTRTRKGSPGSKVSILGSVCPVGTLETEYCQGRQYSNNIL